MVIKSSPLLFAVVLTIGMVSVVTAGAQSQLGNQAANPTSPDSNPSSAGLALPGTYSSGTSGATTNGSGAGASGSANSGSSSSSSSSNNNNPTYTGTDDEDDPSLYRTKTQDSLGAGAMSRDEGQLTAKPRRREKVTVVDSTKKLPTSGTDPKFQSSLLHSSVTSIDDVSLKPDQAADDQQDADAQQDGVDPRFQTRRLLFKPQTTTDGSKKADKPSAAADSSPSPTATPTPTSPNSPNR
jgi:hypothetical protein